MRGPREERWPQHFINEQVYKLVHDVTQLKNLVKDLAAQVEDLERRKADRRGRRPNTERTGERTPG